MYKLNYDLINLIFDYDGRYENNKNKLIKEVNHNIIIYELKKNILIESHGPYYLFLNNDEKEYYNSILNQKFKDFILKNI